jgi:hypothetical protein
MHICSCINKYLHIHIHIYINIHVCIHIYRFKGHNNYAELVNEINPNITIITAGPHIDDSGDLTNILTGDLYIYMYIYICSI